MVGWQTEVHLLQTTYWLVLLRIDSNPGYLGVRLTSRKTMSEQRDEGETAVLCYNYCLQVWLNGED